MRPYPERIGVGVQSVDDCLQLRARNRRPVAPDIVVKILRLVCANVAIRRRHPCHDDFAENLEVNHIGRDPDRGLHRNILTSRSRSTAWRCGAAVIATSSTLGAARTTWTGSASSRTSASMNCGRAEWSVLKLTLLNRAIYRVVLVSFIFMADQKCMSCNIYLGLKNIGDRISEPAERVTAATGSNQANLYERSKWLVALYTA